VTKTNASPLRDARRASRRASRSAIASSGVRGDKRTRGSLLAVLFLLLKEFLLNEIAAAIVARLESGRQREGEGWKEKKCAYTLPRERGEEKRREGGKGGSFSCGCAGRHCAVFFLLRPPLRSSAACPRHRQLRVSRRSALVAAGASCRARALTSQKFRRGQNGPRTKHLSFPEFDRWNRTQVRKFNSQFTTRFPKAHFLAELNVGR